MITNFNFYFKQYWLNSVIIITLLIFLLTLLPANTENTNKQPTPNKLTDYNSLLIYIKLKPYKGKKLLHEDGKIYTAIEDLSKNLEFEYSYDKSQNILTINEKQYNYEYLLKNEKVLYVGLTSCCLFLGYKVDYNPDTNILDISKSGVTTYTQIITPSPIYSDNGSTTKPIPTESLVPPLKITKTGLFETGCYYNCPDCYNEAPYIRLNSLGTFENIRETNFLGNTYEITDTYIRFQCPICNKYFYELINSSAPKPK